MRTNFSRCVACVILIAPLTAPAASPQAPPAAPASDPVALLVSRLDLEKYKATIKGLTQFGDRRQGTERNRKAVDWIEAQLKSYGCGNTGRIIYQYTPPAQAATPRSPSPFGPSGARIRGNRIPDTVNNDP